MQLSNETDNILKIITEFGPLRAGIIKKISKLSTKTVYKHLSKLLDENLIVKTKYKNIAYYKTQSILLRIGSSLSKNEKVINEQYIYFSPNASLIRGIEGFQVWCKSNNFDYQKEVEKYSKKLQSINKIRVNGLISAKKTILSGKNQIYLDNIFFSDFYNINHYGKTKLGQLVYIGKSSQNKDLIREIATLVRQPIQKLIKKYNIRFIGFIPPSVSRKVQFMEMFEKYLAFDKPQLKIEKIKSVTQVPQKSLKRLPDRIINAQTSIFIDPTQKFNHNILLIDDATGSGATLNETAKKIKKISKEKIKVIGYTVVGSYKGFDVISEV